MPPKDNVVVADGVTEAVAVVDVVARIKVLDGVGAPVEDCVADGEVLLVRVRDGETVRVAVGEESAEEVSDGDAPEEIVAVGVAVMLGADEVVMVVETVPVPVTVPVIVPEGV